MSTKEQQKTYVVEHLDPELGAWSALEYATIAHESLASGAKFVLSSLQASLEIPSSLKAGSGVELQSRSVEELYPPSVATSRVCLLDPGAAQELEPADGDQFDVFLFGGILGDDPPRDRTSELRKKGYAGRRLGPRQMTTDTAVRVTRTVVQKRVPLTEIPYVDDPDIRLDEHESTQMPFRYVRGDDGQPVMPEGMLQLIKADADKGIEDLF